MPIEAILPVSGAEHSDICKRCGAGRIMQGTTYICLDCDAPRDSGSGLVNDVADPGVERMNAMLKKFGIPLGEKNADAPKPEDRSMFAQSERPAPTVSTPQPTCGAPTPKLAPFEQAVHEAISRLRSAAMPSDLKQFKAVQKAIATLEKAVAPKQEN